MAAVADTAWFKVWHAMLCHAALFSEMHYSLLHRISRSEEMHGLGG